MKNKTWIKTCLVFAWILSNIMCTVVTYNWVKHSYHPLYSAPAWANLVYAIPFLGIIVLLIIISFYLNRKEKNNHK